MPFWCYILHCHGGRFYTGHTDELERRIAQHAAGTFGGFTSDYAPCELVWSQEFVTRYEALTAEKQIKGWSRAKKLALIRGDWDDISRLAKSKNSASTSSAGTDLENLSHPISSRPSMSAGEVISGTLDAGGLRLDKVLAEASGLSRERVKALIAEGRVNVGGKTATSPSAKTTAGTPFSIAIPPAAEAEAQPQDIPLDIVFEDEHLVVVNKPAGMVVHPAAGNHDGTLVNALLYHCAKDGKSELSGIGGVARPGIVHRIDKDTSGLLVVAKTATAHERLASQFADHSIHRRYLAVCGGHPLPASQRIETKLGRSDKNRKKMAVLPDDSKRGKIAITHLKMIKKLRNCALIECRLETGRTHQIRVHCASIGHALLGDQQYGRTPATLRALLKELSFGRQALHAAELGFVHPASGEMCKFAAPMPADMQELIDETAR